MSQAKEESSYTSSEEYSSTTLSDEYEVEDIIDHKDVGRTRYYYVKWKGYPYTDNSWVDEKDIYCPDLINKYNEELEKLHEATHPISTPVTIPNKILDHYRKGLRMYYKVQYVDGTTKELDSEVLKKFNPMLIVKYLESNTK